MGIRFGKSIRLGKHVRLNISKGGIGVSAGVRGARISTGPRGTRMSTSIPGTGVSYSKTLGGSSSRAPARRTSSPAPPVKLPKPPSPGLFAPGHEKEFHKALTDYAAGKTEMALAHFLKAAPREPSASIFAASLLLLGAPDQQQQAIDLLEQVVQNDNDFPTPLMQKYLSDARLQISITEQVQAAVPVDGLGAALLLAELYQSQDRLDEAIGLIEELEELAGEPVLTLSLCDLYAARGLWDGIIDRGQRIEVADDITLEIAVLYGRAMYEKALYDAAIGALGNALKKKKDRDPDLLQEAAYWRARAYADSGKKSQAAKAFQQLYAENPAFRDVAQRVAM